MPARDVWHCQESKMPAGVGTGEYLRFMAAAMFSMFLGAQTVHFFYRPLDDLDDYVMRAKQEKEKNEKDDPRPGKTEASVVGRLLQSPGAARRDS